MMTKDECRQFINEKKKYLNLKNICFECNVKQPHLTMFLKASYYDHYLNIDKCNALVEFIMFKI